MSVTMCQSFHTVRRNLWCNKWALQVDKRNSKKYCQKKFKKKSLSILFSCNNGFFRCSVSKNFEFEANNVCCAKPMGNWRKCILARARVRNIVENRQYRTENWLEIFCVQSLGTKNYAWWSVGRNGLFRISTRLRRCGQNITSYTKHTGNQNRQICGAE